MRALLVEDDASSALLSSKVLEADGFAVDLAAPAGATSLAYQPLGTTAVDLVTGVTKVAQGGMAVTYKLDATPAAGVVVSATRVVTYTITGGV